jgi:hypothetical protein
MARRLPGASRYHHAVGGKWESDKIVGKTKEVVAEANGGGKLAEEGKEQARKGEKEPAVKPIGQPDKLT